jgi:AcrR family transcriptional regulator
VTGERRRRLPKAERRLVIEETAAKLFAERGYPGTRLDDIATAAGVTKQLLYRHFRSKRELYIALLARYRDEILGRLGAGMSRPAPLAERIATTTDIWFAYVEDNPHAATLLFGDAGGDPEVLAFLRDNHATARALQVALIQTEPSVDLPQDQLEPLAEFYRSASAGLALWWIEHPEVARATVVQVVVDAWTARLELAQRRR